MSNNTVTNGSMLAVTPATVAGFSISQAVGFGVLAIVAGVSMIVLVSSLWSRRSNDQRLGVTK